MRLEPAVLAAVYRHKPGWRVPGILMVAGAADPPPVTVSCAQPT